MENMEKPSFLTRRIAIFLGGIALSELAYTLTMVQIPVFLYELGANIGNIGTFYSIALAAPMLLQIFGGWLSDSLGRMRIIQFGSIAGVLAYIPYLLAPTWEYAILGPALRAVSTSFILPSYRAYLADNTNETMRGRVFGTAESIRSAAWIIGPPVGGLIAQQVETRYCFAAAIASSLFASLIFYILNHQAANRLETPVNKPSLTTLKHSLVEMWALFLSGGLVTWLLITDGIRDVAFHISFDLMPIYLSNIAEISKQGIGLLDGFHGVAWTITSAFSGLLIDKTSERLGVVIGLVGLISSPLIFAFAQGYNGFLLSWILLGVGGAVLDPALNSLIARGVPGRLRGITYALIATSMGIISLPFPWIGSQLWEQFGPRVPFLVTVLFACFAFFPAWKKLRVPRGLDPE